MLYFTALDTFLALTLGTTVVEMRTGRSQREAVVPLVRVERMERLITLAYIPSIRKLLFVICCS